LGLVAAMATALFAAGPTGPVPGTPAARDAFDRGRTAFGRAEYARAIEILRTELVRTLKLLGCESTAALDRSYVNVPHDWDENVFARSAALSGSRRGAESPALHP